MVSLASFEVLPGNWTFLVNFLAFWGLAFRLVNRLRFDRMDFSRKAHAARLARCFCLSNKVESKTEETHAHTGTEGEKTFSTNARLVLAGIFCRTLH